MASEGGFPEQYLSSTHVDEKAGWAEYKRKCTGHPDKIILYLHTWNGDKNQLLGGSIALSQMKDACVISPDFGGPNNRPYALSVQAIAEIKTVLDDFRHKTGLSTVMLTAASGGAIMALNFLGTYPGEVERASLWFPAYNLAKWYGELQERDLKDSMIKIFGHPPRDAQDPDYLARSPSHYLAGLKGPLLIFLNTAIEDKTMLPSQVREVRDRIQSCCAGCVVRYREWPGGHEFNANARYAVEQLLGN